MRVSTGFATSTSTCWRRGVASVSGHGLSMTRRSAFRSRGTTSTTNSVDLLEVSWASFSLRGPGSNIRKALENPRRGINLFFLDSSPVNSASRPRLASYRRPMSATETPGVRLERIDGHAVEISRCGPRRTPTNASADSVTALPRHFNDRPIRTELSERSASRASMGRWLTIRRFTTGCCDGASDPPRGNDGPPCSRRMAAERHANDGELQHHVG